MPTGKSSHQKINIAILTIKKDWRVFHDHDICFILTIK